MNRYKNIIIFAILGLIFFPLFAGADVFINWRAKYYITYPDDWYQVSYGTVNFFLTTQDIDPKDFYYDAVLAKSADDAFFNVPYIFLHFQPVGKLSDKQIDTVLDGLSEEYSNPYSEGSLKDADRHFALARPVYDKALKAVVVKSRITSEVADKYLLEIRKFYDEGIAVFLCYAPKEMYGEAQPIFLSILHSFSTEDLDKVAPKDSFEIVDLSDRESPSYNESDFPPPDEGEGLSDQTRRLIYILILVVVIIGVAGIFIMKKIKKQNFHRQHNMRQ